MRQLNKAILVSNPTRDAELWHMSIGKPVPSMCLATNCMVND
jgi:hypothetical protein